MTVIEVLRNRRSGKWGWRTGTSGPVNTEYGLRHANDVWEVEDEISPGDASAEACEYFKGGMLDDVLRAAKAAVRLKGERILKAAEDRAAQFASLSPEARQEIVARLVGEAT